MYTMISVYVIDSFQFSTLDCSYTQIYTSIGKQFQQQMKTLYCLSSKCSYTNNSKDKKIPQGL